MFQDFSQSHVSTDAGTVFIRRAGSGAGGPAVLLLHGFPETHVAWHLVAPKLAQHCDVIAADLPGLGQSALPVTRTGPLSKRQMARVLVSAMRALGVDQWVVAGHDRGARVAYRMALDFPEHVSRLIILEVVPTLDMLERCDYPLAREMVNWFFLAQPAPLPERLILGTGDLYVRSILEAWAGPGARLDPAAREAYFAAYREPSVVGWACEEYRATEEDAGNDRIDRERGHSIRCPTLVLWSSDGLVARYFDCLATWRRWAADVRGRSIDGGHFLMEENPETVCSEILAFVR